MSHEHRVPTGLDSPGDRHPINMALLRSALELGHFSLKALPRSAACPDSFAIAGRCEGSGLSPSVFASRFAPRHRGGGNLAFCDGHAEWQHGTNVVETRPGRNRGFAIWPDGEMIWTADPFVTSHAPD